MDEYGAARVGGWVDEPIAWRAWNAGAHPRAKAGTPTGGQFAPASGGGSKSSPAGKTGHPVKDTRPTPTNARPVGQGETGKRVSDLQARLNALGAKPPLKLDGIFGPKTLAAVRAFQRSHGLKVDGLVGPLTTAALRRTRHTVPAKTTAKPAKTTTKPPAPAAKTTGAKTAARVAGAVTNPRGTEKLHEYWVHGEGAAKIRWGSPGDFDRCVLHLGKFIADPKGYCAKAHHDALGIWPATHAAQEKKAGRSEVETTQRAEMTSASINDLPDSEFAYIEPGGKKDASGKTTPRSLRHFPVHDAAHVRNALARAPQSPHGAKAMGKIRSRAKKFGVEVSADTASASRTQAEYMRLYPLEDMHIIRSADGGDGRTVEAFAAVFDDPAEIVDHEGHYVEVIDRSAFNKVLADVTRARGGLPGSVKVLYNHGMTIQGTPSERFSMPIGVPVDIRAEARGLLTRTRYNDTPLAEEILENIRAGSITSQSFTGRIVRSDPQLRRGDRHRPDSAGNLRTVRRSELGLREYGPVLWPAYSGAEILGVRMSTPGTLDEDPEPDAPDEEQALPPDGEAAADEPQPPEESHSQRYHQHALYVLRSSKLREEAGLVW